MSVCRTLQLSMLEDPTAPDDQEEEGGEGLVVKQLVYLLCVPQDLEENVTFLLSWAMVCVCVKERECARACVCERECVLW